MLDVDVDDESSRAGSRRGRLAELFDVAGLRGIEQGAISVEVEHPGFDEFREPFTLGVGPAGACVASVGATQRDRLRDLCRDRLPDGSFVISARAWTAGGLA